MKTFSAMRVIITAGAVFTALILLGGCQSIHTQVAEVCDLHGWNSPQCAYAQNVGLQHDAQRAAHGRAMMGAGTRLLTAPPHPYGYRHP